MLLLLDPASGARRGHRPWVRGVVPAITAAAVVARSAFFRWPPGADEAGFLQVAAQWSPGSSLYGSYWVDRPPLLVVLFRAAALTGGLVSLRLIGCAAVVATVLLSAWVARHVSGDVAARWTAVTAAALLVSPLVGAVEVNGELLATPFVAFGLGAGLAAVRRRGDHRRCLVWAFAAGASGTAALLVKQNVADVAVFCVVLGLARVVTRELSVRGLFRLALCWVAGAVVTLVVLGAWTRTRGTSLTGVFYALYPFRLEAARTIAAAGSRFATVRITHIGAAWIASGLAALCVVMLVAVARARGRDSILLALCATVGFDVVSVSSGGSYWLHYLVEMTVPVAIGAGLAVQRRAPSGRTRTARSPRLPVAGVALTCVATVVSLVVVAPRAPTSEAVSIGRAVGSVALPGDTLTTLYGEPQVNFTAGLPSPYPYLWSLPIKTLDPHLHALDSVLTGRSPPTWLVTFGPLPSWGLDTTATRRLVIERYHRVTTFHGQTVYLLDGRTRREPPMPRAQERHPLSWL